MEFIILLVIALAVSAMGFHKFIWFISLGYGFSVAALGAAMLVMFASGLTPVSIVLLVLAIIYGCRLGGYLAIRERKSASYQATMKNDIKDGSAMKLLPKLCIWVSCALLYCCQVSPVFFRLKHGAPDDAAAIIGAAIMLLGVVLESAADYTKNRYKKRNPKRFCDVGLFRLVRCPNYLGEILIWTGMFVSGLTVLSGAWEWIAAVFGWVCIVYIMFGGARRLEIRQNKNYGSDPAYQQYVKSTPIILPLIPLYSVEKYKWLVG
ncbi:MAG: DUF1295 domain-containing protein [Clostridia bacterium]|nr:DUF1295 domain-containing protein [Clostridia bacterium]